MPDNDAAFTGWKRYVLRRDTRTRTTWRFRISVALIAAAAVWLTSGWWTRTIGESLVCTSRPGTSDALLIDNFDPDYLLFERARIIRRSDTRLRVVVPVRAESSASDGLSPVALGMTQVLVELSHVGDVELVPMREIEPITLNAALDVRQYLVAKGIRSVRVVTPLFRSRRAMLVYQPLFGSAGIVVRCEPVQGSRGVDTWHRSWHGIQDVLQQWLKLQYYRFHVRPGSGGDKLR